MIFAIALAAGLATFCGGLFALKFKDRLHLILGFSAGAVIGVAFFDLLPESIELASSAFDISVVTSVVAFGFILFMVLDRFVLLHSHHSDEEHTHDHDHHAPTRGRLGAGSLAIHSFLDGMAIGLAFQVSTAVGIVVTTAVLVHDFSDGINTVGLILKGKGDRKTAFKWLIIDSVAPMLGIFSTLFFSLQESTLGLILAVFTGFFLYIGASDLLPESHHSHPTRWTTIMTILGALVLYAAIHIAHV